MTPRQHLQLVPCRRPPPHRRRLPPAPATSRRSPPSCSAHLGGLDLAVAQHLGDQASDKRLALVSRPAQTRHPVAVPHSKHPAAVLGGVQAAAAAGLGCTRGAPQRLVRARRRRGSRLRGMAGLLHHRTLPGLTRWLRGDAACEPQAAEGGQRQRLGAGSRPLLLHGQRGPQRGHDERHGA